MPASTRPSNYRNAEKNEARTRDEKHDYDLEVIDQRVSQNAAGFPIRAHLLAICKIRELHRADGTACLIAQDVRNFHQVRHLNWPLRLITREWSPTRKPRRAHWTQSDACARQRCFRCERRRCEIRMRSGTVGQSGFGVPSLSAPSMSYLKARRVAIEPGGLGEGADEGRPRRRNRAMAKSSKR